MAVIFLSPTSKFEMAENKVHYKKSTSLKYSYNVLCGYKVFLCKIAFFNR